METEKEIVKSLSALNKDGECHYFNMFQDGGAVCYHCNGVYLLFDIPLYGGEESYVGTYFKKQLPKLVSDALNRA